jgi:hypothetical protein
VVLFIGSVIIFIEDSYCCTRAGLFMGSGQLLCGTVHGT